MEAGEININTTFLRRFWSKVEFEPNSGCHIWVGAKNDEGYGRFYTGLPARRLMMATHAVLLIDRVKVPVGRGALHSCDFPPCVNKKHLFIGTGRDNIKDSIRKRRTIYPRLRKLC